MQIHRILLTFITLLLASCSQATSPSELGRPSNLSKNAREFSLGDGRITLFNGQEYKTLTDCSNDEDFCFADGNDLFLAPKICPDSIVQYYADIKEFEFLGYVHGMVTIKPRKNDNFMFRYSEQYGISALYWDFDKTGAFVDRPELGVDSQRSEQYEFMAPQSGRIAVCSG